VRSRVGYTGGEKLNPTYHSLGDHTETFQLDYDPEQISYKQLLDIFWDNHNPTRKAWSSQYKAAIFVHDETQARLAETSKARLAADKTGKWFNQKIETDILPAKTFYLAEAYHQKYLLQNTPRLWGELLEIYPNPADWLNSSAAARLNGYVGGYGSAAQLAEEIDSLGLSRPAQAYLWQLVRGFENGNILSSDLDGNFRLNMQF
jgi:methionine-S-sulfoxide reductase